MAAWHLRGALQAPLVLNICSLNRVPCLRWSPSVIPSNGVLLALRAQNRPIRFRWETATMPPTTTITEQRKVSCQPCSKYPASSQDRWIIVSATFQPPLQSIFIDLLPIPPSLWLALELKGGKTIQWLIRGNWTTLASQCPLLIKIFIDRINSCFDQLILRRHARKWLRRRNAPN